MQQLNREQLSATGPDRELEGRIESFELAFRMQNEAPGLQDISGESKATVIRQRLDGMSREERSLTKELSLGRLSAADARLGALPGERAAAVLEAGYEYVNFRRITGKSPKIILNAVEQRQSYYKYKFAYSNPENDAESEAAGAPAGELTV